MTRFPMTSCHILLLVISPSVMTSCGSGAQSAVERMLEAARRGEDTSPFWMNGAPKQELFNVMTFEVMSSRPLKDVVKTLLPELHKSERDVDFHIQAATFSLDEELKDIETRRREAAEQLATFAKLEALGPPPLDATIEELVKWHDLVKAIYKHHDVQHPKLDSALSQSLKQAENRFASPDLQSAVFSARNELLIEFLFFEETAALNRIALDQAVANLAEVQEKKDKRLEELASEKATAERRQSALEARLLKSEGFAYKVRVDSTNKGGQTIHNLWTITAVKDQDKKWKVTYLYDERDFAGASDATKLEGLLAMTGSY